MSIRKLTVDFGIAPATFKTDLKDIETTTDNIKKNFEDMVKNADKLKQAGVSLGGGGIAEELYKWKGRTPQGAREMNPLEFLFSSMGTQDWEQIKASISQASPEWGQKVQPLFEAMMVKMLEGISPENLGTPMGLLPGRAGIYARRVADFMENVSRTGTFGTGAMTLMQKAFETLTPEERGRKAARRAMGRMEAGGEEEMPINIQQIMWALKLREQGWQPSEYQQVLKGKEGIRIPDWMREGEALEVKLEEEDWGKYLRERVRQLGKVGFKGKLRLAGIGELGLSEEEKQEISELGTKHQITIPWEEYTKFSAEEIVDYFIKTVTKGFGTIPDALGKALGAAADKLPAGAIKLIKKLKDLLDSSHSDARDPRGVKPETWGKSIIKALSVGMSKEESSIEKEMDSVQGIIRGYLKQHTRTELGDLDTEQYGEDLIRFLVRGMFGATPEMAEAVQNLQQTSREGFEQLLTQLSEFIGISRSGQPRDPGTGQVMRSALVRTILGETVGELPTPLLPSTGWAQEFMGLPTEEGTLPGQPGAGPGAFFEQARQNAIIRARREARTSIRFRGIEAMARGALGGAMFEGITKEEITGEVKKMGALLGKVPGGNVFNIKTETGAIADIIDSLQHGLEERFLGSPRQGSRR